MPELKKGLWHRCFPMNFVKYLRTLFFIEHLLATTSGLCDSWLLLDFCQFFPNSFASFMIMKPFSKSTAEKQGKIWWLVARWGGQWVSLVQVALGVFWVVLDGFCWLRMISDGCRWFAILVVTPILQYTEELSLYFTHSRTWLIEVIQFFFYSK